LPSMGAIHHSGKGASNGSGGREGGRVGGIGGLTHDGAG
jgi:hypothetical protein